MVVVGRIVGEARPQISFQQLQILQDEQRRVRKVDALQFVPQLFLDHLWAHFGRLLGREPVLPGYLRKVVLSMQVGDGRTGVHNGRVGRGAGRGCLDAFHFFCSRAWESRGTGRRARKHCWSRLSRVAGGRAGLGVPLSKVSPASKPSCARLRAWSAWANSRLPQPHSSSTTRCTQPTTHNVFAGRRCQAPGHCAGQAPHRRVPSKPLRPEPLRNGCTSLTRCSSSTMTRMPPTPSPAPDRLRTHTDRIEDIFRACFATPAPLTGPTAPQSVPSAPV